MDETTAVTSTARDRFKATLETRAAAVKCVRNDVFTVKYWQLALNFILGGGAVAAVICSMVLKGSASTWCVVASVALVVVVVVYNLALKAVAPTSFLQYTAKDGDRRYCYQIIGKATFLFCDGERAAVYDRGNVFCEGGVRMAHLAFDFFAQMEPAVRIGKADREIYKGTLDVGGKTVRCKIIFKNNVPYVGTVGGARIKYFDVNDTKDKFVIPEELATATKQLDMRLPKLNGVHVRTIRGDATKQ